MRIIRLSIFLLLFIPVLGFGQLHLGVKGGYNISSISFIPDQKERPIYNGLFDAGLIVKYYDLTYFGFQAELNFTQRGYRSPIDEEIYKRRVNSYLEMPMFMQIRIKQNDFFAHLNAGVSLSYLLSAKEGTNETGDYVMSSYNPKILRDHRVDYGLIGGAGIGYEFGWGTLQVDVKYYYGLGDLYKYDYEGNPTRSPAWVQNISLSYLYNISKKKSKKNISEEKIKFEDSIENLKKD
jgi:hypothetical protein